MIQFLPHWYLGGIFPNPDQVRKKGAGPRSRRVPGHLRIGKGQTYRNLVFTESPDILYAAQTSCRCNDVMLTTIREANVPFGTSISWRAWEAKPCNSFNVWLRLDRAASTGVLTGWQLKSCFRLHGYRKRKNCFGIFAVLVVMNSPRPSAPGVTFVKSIQSVRLVEVWSV